MPRPSKGARLWLRPAERDADGRLAAAARWIIKDAGRQFSTGCLEGDRAQAERKLAEHIARKYAPERRERDLAQILVTDVLNIYLRDVAPGHARPQKTVERCLRLGEYFLGKTLADVSGSTCRAYEASRAGMGRSTKGAGGGARRDLQDLAAAINHHAREGFHRGEVRVALPSRGKSRQRWLTRDEAAQLIWTCWKTRESQNGRPTEKRPLRHLCRFLLLGLYTGSRPGALLNAAWLPGPNLSYVDIARGVFHRHADGAAVTNKRQPTVKLSPRLKAHLKRWRRLDFEQAPPNVFVVSYGGEKIASVKTALARACSLAGLDAGVTAYTLRHTVGSWLMAKGVPTRKIAEFLGCTETMVLEHYGHLAPDFQDEAAQAIGRK